MVTAITNRIKTGELAYRILDRIKPRLADDEPTRNRIRHCEKMIEGIFLSAEDDDLWLNRAVDLTDTTTGTPTMMLYDLFALLHTWHTDALARAH
jgi:hypothetical protein